jgi:hypothetical protein
VALNNFIKPYEATGELLYISANFAAWEAYLSGHDEACKKSAKVERIFKAFLTKTNRKETTMNDITQMTRNYQDN